MREPKFRAVCECGAKSPPPATDFTTEKWMKKHRTEHLEPECKHRQGYGNHCLICGTNLSKETP